uniref:Phosphate uptake regulator PhoU n=1 Tax=Geoglobus ahangari TaxID=113653 RepID=A0A7C4W4F5_9EURY
MESRKLQLIGGSSYMISLPKNWVRKNELDQGDEILLDISDEVIKIIPKKLTEKHRIVRAVVDNIPKYDESFFRRFIIALYIQGLDEIILQDKLLSPKIVEIISSIAREIIGMEVIDASDGKVVLRSLTTAEFDVEGVLRRMSQIISGMMNSIVDYIRINDKNSLKEIPKHEEDIDRLYFLAVRLENRRIRDLMSPSKWSEMRHILGMRITAKILEELADALIDFSENLYSHENYNADEYAGTLSLVNNVFNKVMVAYLNSDLVKANEAIDMVDELENKLLSKLEEKDASLIYPLVDICRRIKGIGEIAINRSVREMIT